MYVLSRFGYLGTCGSSCEQSSVRRWLPLAAVRPPQSQRAPLAPRRPDAGAALRRSVQPRAGTAARRRLAGSFHRRAHHRGEGCVRLLCWRALQSAAVAGAHRQGDGRPPARSAHILPKFPFPHATHSRQHALRLSPSPLRRRRRSTREAPPPASPRHAGDVGAVRHRHRATAGLLRAGCSR